MSKTIQISGIARTKYLDDDFLHYYLEQPDGNLVDLVLRVAEIAQNMGGSMAVEWWVSDTPKTKDEMVAGFLARVYGEADSRYWKEEYQYSSWTYGTYDRQTCEVGGHSLIIEFQDGQFMLFEFTSDPENNN